MIYEQKQAIAKDITNILGLSPNIDYTLEERKLTYYIKKAAELVDGKDPLSTESWKYLISNKLVSDSVVAKRNVVLGVAVPDVVDIVEETTHILDETGAINTFGVRTKIFDKPSATVRIIMLLCDNYNLSVSDIKSTLIDMGYTVGDNTVGMQYNDCRKVLAYLNRIGKLGA